MRGYTFFGQNVLIGHANWKGLYANDATTGCLLWENKDVELIYRSASVTWVENNVYLLSSHSLFIWIRQQERSFT